MGYQLWVRLFKVQSNIKKIEQELERGLQNYLQASFANNHQNIYPTFQKQSNSIRSFIFMTMVRSG
ncbi:hypothetical protein CEH05_16820 [Halobacillus halophilus]|uniref:Uncharacterized protein n=1 Tax=Halobacillus halophilus (strain ATCC 35676 / DSM 2266 / JCM 20832 / KCTC 3685 / LMG 17431 / NBRC 102448 / NCIMB 2269) TaxID=866895 RepID=I0JRI2_HALH3|nr:hypothetical protein CEH05_16820 [Halobacillus halophilus]CCG46753.1 hypothetical protein HBHAL_4413 [Halobacillus halophilus DSM 2266]